MSLSKFEFLPCILLGSVLFLISCSKNDTTPSPGSTITTVPTSYSAVIFYQNSSGQDLLDPATKGYFTQRAFDVSWYTLSNNKKIVVVTTDTVFKNKTYPTLPSAYCFVVPGNNSSSSLVKYINFTKPFIIDSLTFVYTGTTLKQLFYNKTLVSPPSNMTSYPAEIPVIITK